MEFSVCDTGVGISDDDLKRLFQDFVVLDASYSREVGGTGLGLAVCRRLIELMGGEIGVESRLPEGSRFWFRLPMLAAGCASEARPHTRELPGATAARLRGLLVEDNDISREVAEQMLAGAARSVTVASDGFAAVEKAESDEFDVILMDISMPRMDGIEATWQIRKGGRRSSGAVIIGVTAHAQPTETAHAVYWAGMQTCLTKLLRLAQLRETLAATEQQRERTG